MANFSTNEFKSGLKVMLDGDPCSIIENEFVKPGKGQAFNRVKLRNLKNSRVMDKTFKSGETLEGADVMDVSMQYLYEDGEFYYFMDPETFEQKPAEIQAIAENKSWLKPQDVVEVTLYNDNPIAITVANFVDLEITQTDPGLKGDTAQGGTKPIVLETGIEIRGPLFLEIGDQVKVDTRTGDYVSRVKKQ